MQGWERGTPLDFATSIHFHVNIKPSSTEVESPRCFDKKHRVNAICITLLGNAKYGHMGGASAEDEEYDWNEEKEGTRAGEQLLICDYGCIL